jgi:hypothetical protein
MVRRLSRIAFTVFLLYLIRESLRMPPGKKGGGPDTTKRDTIQVTDVWPGVGRGETWEDGDPLTVENRDPVVDRLSRYGAHYSDNPSWQLHPDSRSGSFIALGRELAGATTDTQVQRAWNDIVLWADEWGVQII